MGFDAVLCEDVFAVEVEGYIGGCDLVDAEIVEASVGCVNWICMFEGRWRSGYLRSLFVTLTGVSEPGGRLRQSQRTLNFQDLLGTSELQVQKAERRSNDFG